MFGSKRFLLLLLVCATIATTFVVFLMNRGEESQPRKGRNLHSVVSKLWNKKTNNDENSNMLTSFSVTPDYFKDEAGWVTASWTTDPAKLTKGSGAYLCIQDSYCITEPNVNLWIGVFEISADLSQIGPQDWPCSQAPWLASAPIKWKPIYTSVGQVQFYMERGREDFLFGLFANGTTYPELLSVHTVQFEGKEQPNHVHIARTQDPGEMLIMWQSKFQEESPAVKFGFQSGKYTKSVPARSSTYSKSDLCGPPATTYGWVEPGFFYQALITGIEEGQVIYYVVGNDRSGWTKESHFKGVKRPNANAVLNITATADMGLTYIDGSQYHWMEPYAIRTTENIRRAWSDGKEDGLDNTDVLVHVGDISYATGFASKWDRFLTQIEPIASRVPYMTGHGNHERDYPRSGDIFGGGDSGGECGVATSARFQMPTPSENGAWYSFDQGSVHFVMMDTELSYQNTSEQYQFLVKDLSSVDRSVTPWVIFMGHRPMYSGNTLDARLSVLEPLLLQYKVDLCLWGHVHNAQVTCPVYNKTCVPTNESGEFVAPIHAVIGNAGQSLTAFPEPKAPWSIYQNSEFGYSTIHVDGWKSLNMKFFGDLDNDLHYEFTITRNAPSKSNQ